MQTINNFGSLSVKAKLKLINTIIVIAGVISVVGAFEIAKGAKLHELNFLHVKYNHVFSTNVARFESGFLIDTKTLSANIRDIRQQPIDCLKIATWFERTLMKAIGTYDAIELCHDDLRLGDNILNQVQAYEEKKLTKDQFLTALNTAVSGFTNNSEKFEPFVSRTVSLVLRIMIALITLIAIVATLIGMLLSRSLGADYKRLAKTEASLEERTTKLEEKNSALEQFSYHTSHDLKSPLTSIRGLTHFVKQDIKSGNINEATINVDHIEKLAYRGEELIQDILNITRSDALSESIVEVDISGMIDDITDQLALQIKEKRIHISHNHNHTHTLRCQANRLRQSLENLLSNAIKYCGPTNEDKRIETTTYSNNTEFVIKIKDNGLGIPPSQHARVFGMFSRFHRQSANGSGLGLYLVKKHITQINGIVSFTSRPGDTCFTITLPINE